jgi:hypothetical protein
MSAKACVKDLTEKVMANLAVLRAEVDAVVPQSSNAAEVLTAMEGLEFYVAVTLRILAKTNASKVRSEAITQEIATRMKS